MWLAFLILLAYSFPAFSLECYNYPYCGTNPASNYTLILNVSSRVLVQDKGSNYVLAGEEVTLIATAYNNSFNFTDLNNQSQVYYYNFFYHNLAAPDIWHHINYSEESTAVKIWHHGGRVECLVQLLTQDNKTLAYGATLIVIAVEKDGFCVVVVNTSQEYHNLNKSAYAVGNVTFVVDIGTESSEYFLYYSFGDNTSATLKVRYTSDTSLIHNYTDVCNNCSYDVSIIMLSELKPPQYCTEPGIPINVIKPVTSSNSDIFVNSGKLYKGHPAKLKMTSGATPPFNVCWHLYDPTVKHNISAHNCPLLNSTGTECQTLNSTVVFNPTITFASTGSYMLLVSIENNANCTVKNHTLSVEDAVPVTAEVVGSVVGIVIACVIIFILIITVLGYIQYRRYKNRHIETAKFNFVVLPPINTNSRWARFKMRCRKRWYKFRGRRFRKGLVPMLDGSGRYTYSDSYSTTVSYGTLLQSEHESYKDLQVSVLHDYVSSGFHEDNNDDR